MQSREYLKQLHSEVEHYAASGESDPLPPIAHWFGEEILRWFLNDLIGQPGFVELASDEINRIRERQVGSPVTVVSLGAGHAQVERSLLSRLALRPLGNVKLFALDLVAPNDVELFSRSGCTYELVMKQTDLNGSPSLPKANVLLAHHSLHHIIALESLSAACCRSVADSTGVFVIGDMIGRNGHQRWPEALTAIEYIWGRLPERYRQNRIEDRVDSYYDDRDCSREGFEGIRAQDIVTSVSEYFVPRDVAYWGGVIDPFIERTYGFNFDPARCEDRKIIKNIWETNLALSKKRIVSPTQLLGVFELSGAGRLNKSQRPGAARSVLDLVRTQEYEPGAHAYAVNEVCAERIEFPWAARAGSGEQVLPVPSNLDLDALPEGVFREGWLPAEGGLRWAVGKKSSLCFCMAEANPSRLTFGVVPAPGVASRIRISCSLCDSGSFAEIRGGSVEELTLTWLCRCPSGQLSDRMAHVQVTCDEPMRPTAENPDKRPLVLGFFRLTLHA